MSELRDKPKPKLFFKCMSLILRMRDRIIAPELRLKDIDIKKGQVVLDYGAGIGSFTIPVAEMVGSTGLVYSLDIHPLSIQLIEKRIKKRKLTNIKTILSDRDTGLPNESVNIVLLYDVFHMVKDKQKLLRELHRILKSDGLLSVYAMHIKTENLLEIMNNESLFSLNNQRGKVFNFKKRRKG